MVPVTLYIEQEPLMIAVPCSQRGKCQKKKHKTDKNQKFSVKDANTVVWTRHSIDAV